MEGLKIVHALFLNIVVTAFSPRNFDCKYLLSPGVSHLSALTWINLDMLAFFAPLSIFFIKPS